MATGFIKRMVRDRGFGFIRDERGTEYFFHRSGVVQSRRAKGEDAGGGYDAPMEGDTVSFDHEDGGDKGPRATNIASC